MKKALIYSLTIATIAIYSCSEEKSPPESSSSKNEAEVSESHEADSLVQNKTPQEMLKTAYQLFKEGNDVESIAMANKVLEIGRAENNDTLIGGALSSLCRNAQRTLDTTRLAELSEELKALSLSSGDQSWMMKRAHMNAEMWRLIGEMDRAEAFYNESMQISESIGAMGMFTIDHFNKSFVSTAKGDFKEAKRLIKKYYALRLEKDPETEDAYGLIALAYFLEQQGNYEGAHEVAAVTRRLFEEQNLFPEPPDEKPLIAVEAKVKTELDTTSYNSIIEGSQDKTVQDLLDSYLM
jgi:tetratricopeptide (TPR) repeat protein